MNDAETPGHTAAELLARLTELSKTCDLASLLVQPGSRCCGGDWDGNLELSGNRAFLYLTGDC